MLKFAKNFIISLIVSLFVVYSQDYPVQPAQQSIPAYIVHLIILYLLADMYKDYLKKGYFNTSILIDIFLCVCFNDFFNYTNSPYYWYDLQQWL